MPFETESRGDIWEIDRGGVVSGWVVRGERVVAWIDLVYFA